VTRIAQPTGAKGSLRWIQRAVNERWDGLDRPILTKLPGATSIEWRSPLGGDDFAEYRDGEFLDGIGLNRLRPALKEFWPERGPQWDALGVSDRGDVLLVEAKAHVAEMCSPGTAAGPQSRERINRALVDCADRLGARASRAAWTDHFYQLANRFAHLHFLREQGVPAYLVLVNFLNDLDMKGPTTPEAWEAAYEVAFHVMGLPKRHVLAQYVIEVFPDVSVAN
jgi:hypothetical protein